MKTIAPAPESQIDEPEFKRLTAQEVRELREANPSVSPWWVVGGQVVVGLLVAVGAWGITTKAEIGWSAAYGALVVILPAAVFARGLTGRFASLNAGTAVLGFFLWEMVKMALSLAMLVAAPGLAVGLRWPALLLGLFLTMKVYWVAMAFSPKRVKRMLERTGE